jgi:hypothetical protein
LWDERRNTYIRGGGICVLWEEEFMFERRRNACVMGEGIFI